MSPSIDEIRTRVSGVMRQRGVARAGVFGSVSRGTPTTTSDLDFLVEFEQGRTLLDLVALRFDLREVLGREVDVATSGSLHPRLRDQILGELIPIL